ncbi:MAG: LPS sulfotransferase NodH [Colwellia sp.]
MKTTDELLFDLMVSLKGRKSIPLKITDRKVLILSTPRSGSTLFCDVLNSTAKIGECREWFNMRYIAAFAKMNKTANINFSDYFNFISQKTIRNTGIFAVNIHIEQYIAMLNNKIDVKSLGFDFVVYLYRKDKISQSVSLAIAQISDQWSSSTNAVQDISGKINTKVISNALNHIVESEYIYNENFKSVTDIECSYEDFSDLNKTACFSNILDSLNIKIPKFRPAAPLKQQRNDFSNKVKTEYLKYLTGDYQDNFKVHY